MSRSHLCVYEMDRDALKELSGDLRTALYENGSEKLIELLELKGSVAEAVKNEARLVDFFLRGEDDPIAKTLLASVRRISRKRALTKVFTSEAASLEGRLRAFEPLREERKAARLVDRLLNAGRMPWYLQRPTATCGWLKASQRNELASMLRKLRPALTPEMVAFADAVDEAEGDIVVHDGL